MVKQWERTGHEVSQGFVEMHLLGIASLHPGSATNRSFFLSGIAASALLIDSDDHKDSRVIETTREASQWKRDSCTTRPT
jgi:hypothetical protein